MYEFEQIEQIEQNSTDKLFGLVKYNYKKLNLTNIIILFLLTITVLTLFAVATTTTIIFTMQNISIDNCTYNIENNLLYPNTVDCYLEYMDDKTKVSCYDNPVYDQNNIIVPCYTFERSNKYYAEKTSFDSKCLSMQEKYSFGCCLPILSWILGCMVLLPIIAFIVFYIKNGSTQVETI